VIVSDSTPPEDTPPDATATVEDLPRYYRRRPGKSASHDDRQSPCHLDIRNTLRKDVTSLLDYGAVSAVDLGNGLAGCQRG